MDPKKAMDIGCKRYSREKFDGYEYRAVVEISYTRKGEGIKVFNQQSRFDIYTDETNREKAERELQSRGKDNVNWIEIVHWASKGQDDLAAKLIDETLKDL